jgi:hypothetical protein
MTLLHKLHIKKIGDVTEEIIQPHERTEREER